MRRAAWILALALALAGPAAAKDLLQGLAAAGDLHGRFIQTKAVAGLSKPLVSRGSFALLRGRGLVWRTERPLPGTVVLTAQGVFLLDNGASRRLAAGGEALSLMNQLLSGDAASLRRIFDVKEQPAGRGWRLSLVPRQGPLSRIFRRIEAAGGAFAEQARLQEASGDETNIRFEGVAAGAGALQKGEEALLGRP